MINCTFKAVYCLYFYTYIFLYIYIGNLYKQVLVCTSLRVRSSLQTNNAAAYNSATMVHTRIRGDADSRVNK